MIRISIYHWLPITDTMLLEVEKQLRALAPHQVSDIELERDAVIFHSTFKYSRDFRSSVIFPLPGKINQRGFCQHVLTIAPIPGVPLNALLNDIIPALVQSISELLYAIAPKSVRNMLAVLNAGMTPIEQFQSSILEPPLEQAARAFLLRNQVTAILLDECASKELRDGFVIPNLDIHVNPFEQSAGAFTSGVGNSILFYSTEFTPDEWATHDSVLYKYCALLLYTHTVNSTLSLLKQARDHLIPLRRQVVLALQHDLAGHFESLTHIQRYLMYVNIKLPVIKKIIRHLQATRSSQTFAAKIATFDEPIKIDGYPTIRSIDNTVWQPPYLIGKIADETRRVETLLVEDISEIQILSTELSQLLENGLLMEQLQIARQSLAAVQAQAGAEERVKHMAENNRIMFVLMVAVFGMLIVQLARIGILWTLSSGIIIFAVGYLASTVEREQALVRRFRDIGQRLVTRRDSN